MMKIKMQEQIFIQPSAQYLLYSNLDAVLTSEERSCNSQVPDILILL